MKGHKSFHQHLEVVREMSITAAEEEQLARVGVVRDGGVLARMWNLTVHLGHLPGTIRPLLTHVVTEESLRRCACGARRPPFFAPTFTWAA